MVYCVFKLILRGLLWIFFKKVEIQGRENAPETGPVIFAGNHPNMALDAFLIGVNTKRKVHYLAKSPLFKNPVMAWFLRSCCVIPLYRRQDNPTEMGKNQSSFSACYSILGQGGTLGIFPEGTSHAEPQLKELKTGAARIALETEERNQNSLGITIVPVGLNFKNREQFRSSVLVIYGKPISLAPFLEPYKDEPKETVHKLTDKIDEAIREITLNMESQEEAQLIQKLEKIYRKEFLQKKTEPQDKHRLLTNLLFNQNLVDGYHYFQKTKPEKVKKLKRQLDVFFRLTEASKVHPEVVGLKMSRWGVFFYGLSNLLLFVLGLPLAIYATLNQYLPYKIPKWVAEKQTPYLEEIATLKLILGIIIFPLFYLLQSLVVFFLISPFWAILYLISLPLTGLIVLPYLDWMGGFFRGVSFYMPLLLNRDLHKKLEEKKKALLEELDELTREFMELKKSKPSPDLQ